MHLFDLWWYQGRKLSKSYQTVKQSQILIHFAHFRPQKVEFPSDFGIFVELIIYWVALMSFPVLGFRSEQVLSLFLWLKMDDNKMLNFRSLSHQKWFQNQTGHHRVPAMHNQTLRKSSGQIKKYIGLIGKLGQMIQICSLVVPSTYLGVNRYIFWVYYSHRNQKFPWKVI